MAGMLYTCLLAQVGAISQGAVTITIGELRDHVYYLASDELEGRLPGTSGFQKAIEYAITQLRQAGLSPVCKTSDSKLSYYQDILMKRYSPGTDHQIKITKDGNERRFVFEHDYIMISGNPYEIEELSGGVVLIGGGIREPEYGIDDYKNIDVKGKWVIALMGEENLPQSVRKKLPQEILQKYQSGSSESCGIITENADNAGALGVIFLPNRSYPLKSIAGFFHEKHISAWLKQSPWSFSIPVIYTDSSMVNYLFDGEKHNPLRDKDTYKTFVLRNSELTLHKEYSLSTMNTANVVALIEGTDSVLKNEYIVLGAHIDHKAVEQDGVMNGADDNASGCAAVLEIAEALVQSKPRRSVICVLYTGEELGFWGSYFFTEKPPVPLENIMAKINIDMIGRPDGISNELSAIGAERINPRLQQIIFNVNNKTMQIILDTVNYNNSYNRSDQYPFYLKRIPAVMFTTGEHKDYHTPADDTDKIDYAFMQNTCQLVYEIISELANGDISLKD